jgi:hypothetical protein
VADTCFVEGIMKSGLMPPRAPDLNTCEFYLWGMLKDKLYSNSHSDEDKGAMYIRVTLYCGYLECTCIVTISFGYILYCVCFNLCCGGFMLFCNVCVCVCFVKMYTVL